MIETRKIGSLTELTASEGFIHRIGSDVYVKRCVMTGADTLDMFEEVAEVPPFTRAEYEAMVARLVRERYSDSEEFALQRKVINSLLSPLALSADAADKVMAEYAEYNNYVEDCKARAKEPAMYTPQKEADA